MHLFRIAVIATVTLLGSGAAANAASFTVDGTADAVDASPGNGTCATAGGACTLRAALQEANALAGADDVTLPAGTFTLSLGGRNEDDAATGDLDVRETVTLTGAGAGQTIVDAAGIDRVFDVWVDASFSDLTIRGGNPLGSAAGFEDGGGILELPEFGTITLNVSGVRLTGNTALKGGGIFVGTDTTLHLSDADLDANTASSGGGIEVTGDALGATLTNVTVSGNTAGAGDGLNVMLAVDLTHVTLAQDGLDISDGATATLTATVLGTGVACAGLGATVSNGFNVEAGNSCGLAGTGDVVNTDALLGPLQTNGGGTLTHALAAGSPAIDRVTGTCGVTTDQRGFTRPLDGDGDTVARCDAGAYEYDPTVVTTTTSTSITTTTSNTTTTLPGGCSPALTVTDFTCRVGALGDALTAAGTVGKPLDGVLAKLTKASEKLALVQPALDEAKTAKAKKQVKKASGLVKKVANKLASAKKGPKVVADEGTRTALAAGAEELSLDLLAFRDTL
jgi:CSLREA domain-containing protein